MLNNLINEWFVDIDECATNKDNCDDNAQCDNTVGGFTCRCNTGYSGDGVTCAGTYGALPIKSFLD